MDIFQTIISHYPKWSKIELITVFIVMIISLIILERYYKKNKITKKQMFFSILFILYILHVYGSTVFSRLPSTRKYQLEVFWSWKKGLLIGICISFSIELLQLILCRGLFEFDDIIHNSLGFFIGILMSNKIILKSK